MYEELHFEGGLPAGDPRTDPAVAVLRSLVRSGHLIIEAEPQNDGSRYVVDICGQWDSDGAAVRIHTKLKDAGEIARWLDVPAHMIETFPAGTTASLRDFFATMLPVVAPNPDDGDDEATRPS